jgi:hypothetical protein
MLHGLCAGEGRTFWEHGGRDVASANGEVCGAVSHADSLMGVTGDE